MKVKTLSLLALFIALAVVGAAIKVPAVVGSVALDTFPALLATVLIGSGAGAIVAAGGHLISALFGGMPLGPMHFLVALEMSLIVFFFGALYRKGKKYMAAIWFVLSNTLLAPLPFLFLMGMGFYMAIVPSILIGSLINIVVSFLLIPRVAQFFVPSLLEGTMKS
ncbi:ECF transporter S component [Bacillus sp. 31A1R]|uniref:ECF transporter S component n=1 Tax=Robertmurraya mangrovi TaxID=3098077 RepID=A0ABU5J4E0_9BACI|nr:ECF transporter S component [Bacillus sp. 31A1R]MDZ5474217.1 ECF transporter S component [Bacillus sp. 31A1R]